MNNYTVTITTDAQEDLVMLETNLSILFGDSVQGANSVISFYKFIETLQFFPNRFPLIRDSIDGIHFQRKCILNHYNIYYDVDDENLTVLILRVIHGKQKQPNSLSDVIGEGDELYPDGRIALSDLLKGMSEEECRIYLTEIAKKK